MRESDLPTRRFRRLVQFAVLAVLAVMSCTTDGPTGLQDAVETVVLNLSLSKLTVGQQLQAEALARNAAGTALQGIPISWSSANPAIASVSPAGIVTAVAPGTTEITAAAASRTAVAS